jgi:hypothetical protein
MRIRKGIRSGASGYKARIIMFVFFVSGAALYAQAGGDGIVPAQLVTLGQQILDAFTGTLVRVILGCCFAGSCVAYAYNKDNEKMKSKILAVLVAAGLLTIASTVVDTIMNA